MYDSVEAERRTEEEHGKSMREDNNKLTLELGALKRHVKEIEDKQVSLSKEKLDLDQKLSTANMSMQKMNEKKESEMKTGSLEIERLKQALSEMENEKTRALQELEEERRIKNGKACCTIQ